MLDTQESFVYQFEKLADLRGTAHLVQHMRSLHQDLDEKRVSACSDCSISIYRSVTMLAHIEAFVCEAINLSVTGAPRCILTVDKIDVQEYTALV